MDSSNQVKPARNVSPTSGTSDGSFVTANDIPYEQGVGTAGGIATATDQTLQIEQKLFRLEPRRLSLEDSSNIVARRDRLQQLGCVFTNEGELVKYGNPDPQQDFDEMLHAGSAYDHQWEKILAHPLHRSTINAPEMWTVLRTLKKLLGNEGMEFDIQNQRIVPGDDDDDSGMNPHLIRLCYAYDDIHKTWAASTLTKVPGVSLREESEATGGARDSGNNAPKAEENDAQHTRGIDRKTEPQSIGWHFLNDSAESVTGRKIEPVHDEIQRSLDRVLALASAMSVQSPATQLSQHSAANPLIPPKSVGGSVESEPVAFAVSSMTPEHALATSEEPQTSFSLPKKDNKVKQWARAIFRYG